MNSKLHHYKADIKWTGNRGEGTSAYQAYDRDYRVSVQGKQDLDCSADPAFRGDALKYNPEDLLLSSLSSCHMLWFLHLCADKGIIVTDYIDHAEGLMEEIPGQGGHFTKVVLNPVVTITDISKAELANSLHTEAGKKCFITNSCRFPVEYNPRCTE